MADFNILIEDKQSIMDVAMQVYGEVAGIFLLMADNPDVISSLNTQLQPGDRLGIQQNPESIEDYNDDYFN